MDILKACPKCGYDFGIVIHTKDTNLVVESLDSSNMKMKKMLSKEDAPNMCESCRMDYNTRILIASL